MVAPSIEYAQAISGKQHSSKSANTSTLHSWPLAATTAFKRAGILSKPILICLQVIINQAKNAVCAYKSKELRLRRGNLHGRCFRFAVRALAGAILNVMRLTHRMNEDAKPFLEANLA